MRAKQNRASKEAPIENANGSTTPTAPNDRLAGTTSKLDRRRCHNNAQNASDTENKPVVHLPNERCPDAVVPDRAPEAELRTSQVEGQRVIPALSNHHEVADLVMAS